MEPASSFLVPTPVWLVIKMHLFTVIMKWPRTDLPLNRSFQSIVERRGDQMTNIRRVCHGSCVSFPRSCFTSSSPMVGLPRSSSIYLFILHPLSMDVRGEWRLCCGLWSWSSGRYRRGGLRRKNKYMARSMADFCILSVRHSLMLYVAAVLRLLPGTFMHHRYSSS